MPTIVDYLNHLDSDATALQAHNSDPTTSMTQFGLSAIQQETFMTGDKAAIANLEGIDVSDLPMSNATNLDAHY